MYLTVHVMVRFYDFWRKFVMEGRFLEFDLIFSAHQLISFCITLLSQSLNTVNEFLKANILPNFLLFVPLWAPWCPASY